MTDVWPRIRFGGQDKTQRNHAIELTVKMTDGDAEVSRMPRGVAGPLNFRGLVFATDSRPYHIATPLAKPVQVLVDPTSAAELDIFRKGRIHLHSGGYDCSYSSQRSHERSCFDRLPLGEVLRATAACLI
jgi:hypothetical protein